MLWFTKCGCEKFVLFFWWFVLVSGLCQWDGHIMCSSSVTLVWRIETSHSIEYFRRFLFAAELTWMFGCCRVEQYEKRSVRCSVAVIYGEKWMTFCFRMFYRKPFRCFPFALEVYDLHALCSYRAASNHVFYAFAMQQEMKKIDEVVCTVIFICIFKDPDFVYLVLYSTESLSFTIFI